jgi:signal transduction histidine kinase
VRLPSTLRYRWDVDPDTQPPLPFDRMIALINVRRIEIASLLGLANYLIELVLGFDALAMIVAIPATIVFACLSRRIQHWQSLRAQQAAAVAFIAAGLLHAVWTAGQVSQNGRLSSGFLLNLLSLAMLFVLPPRTLALLLGGAVLVYAPVVMQLPPPLTEGERITGIVNAIIVWGIAQVAGWLIFSARRSDYEQRRIIRAQNARLTHQNHERDQLMAITAHDLRSPLYGLRNLLDLASRRAERDGTSQIGPMRDAVFGLESMITLVSRLLEAHSAEHEPLTAGLREDLRSHLLAALRRIGPASEVAGVQVAVDLPEGPLVTIFDGNALSRILDNLLSNAVRFSSHDTPVRMRCAAHDGMAIVEIEDAGPGFDTAGRAAMFSKFHQREGQSGGAKSGVGMGLFIAASFAERMGATLSYRPVEPSGACFSLAIPLG